MQWSDPISDTGVKGSDLGKLSETILHCLFMRKIELHECMHLHPSPPPPPPTHTQTHIHTSLNMKHVHGAWVSWCCQLLQQLSNFLCILRVYKCFGIWQFFLIYLIIWTSCTLNWSGQRHIGWGLYCKFFSGELTRPKW